MYEQIVERTLARRREADQGVMSLFSDLGGGGEPVFDDARVPIGEGEFDKAEKLAFEKEMLGLYVSDHPLLGVEAALARHAEATIGELREQGAAGGEARWVGGVVTGINRKYTKRGELMATFVLEDLVSAIDVWVFPRTMSEVAHLLVADAVVCVKGRLDLRDDEPKLICMDIRRPDLDSGAEALHLEVPLQALSENRVERLKQLLCEHRGSSPVYLHFGTKCIRLTSEFSVDTTNGLLAELRVLLGPSCLWNNTPRSA